MTTLRQVDPSPRPEPVAVGTPTASREVEAAARELREWLFSPSNYFVGRLVLLVTRPLGLESYSVRGAIVAGLTTTTVRLLLPVLAGLAVGELSGSPVGRWALIAGLLGLMDAFTTYRMRETTDLQRDLMALGETLTRDDDARALLSFTRRRYRLRVSAPFAAGFAALALLSVALVSPAAFDALPVGSTVLLGILAFEMGEFAFMMVGFMVPLLGRLARYDHRLFWLSPLDSDPIRRMLHAMGRNMTYVGVSNTQYLVLAVVLISLDSPLVLPVVAAFTLAGYVTIAIIVMSARRAVRTIATRIRDRHLSVLQERIDDFGARLGSLSPTENDELRHLVETYRAVRDAPTSPSASETFGHAAKALLIPTLGFVLAVMSEVYAERLLDQLLP